MPTYPDIQLSLFAASRVRRRLLETAPDALHIATEGPLGMAARRAAIRQGWPFTTAYHTRFPEYVHARFKIPVSVTYRFLRWFHGPAAQVMVPTQAISRALAAAGFAPERLTLWSRGVDLERFKPGNALNHDVTPPIFLCVGRVAVEKNIEAFLSLDLPGTKWVAGEGPALEALKGRFPEVRFTGVMTQAELASLYNAASVFVFPSRTDTFGLVLLEAMACGCPVAAYPVDGPNDVIADGPGGVLDEDLRRAALAALEIPRSKAREHAERYSWAICTAQFVSAMERIQPDTSKAQAQFNTLL